MSFHLTTICYPQDNNIVDFTVSPKLLLEIFKTFHSQKKKNQRVNDHFGGSLHLTSCQSDFMYSISSKLDLKKTQKNQ